MAENKREQLYDLVEDFDTAMLVTRATDGQLRSRPMALAETERDGDLWFCTGLDSAKVEEIELDPRVNVALQGKNRFVSITGTAEVVRDRAKIDELWNEMWKVWFPDGKDDPNLALLRVDATEGEFWDNEGGNAVKFLFEAVTAYVSGTEQHYDEDQNQKVNL